MIDHFACATAFIACNNDGGDKKCGAQIPCADGMLCVDHKCVVPECSATKSCEAADKICNDEGKCVNKTEVFECGIYARCTNDLECVDHKCVKAECSLTKKCKAGMLCNDDAICVPQNNLYQCGLNLACVNAALKCNDKNLCVECTEKSDYAKGDCNDEGLCIEPCTEHAGAEIAWDTAVLRIDEQGQVISMAKPASDTNLAKSGYAFCALETEDGPVNPSSTTQCGDQVAFNFPSGQRIVFRVSTGPSFSYWKTIN